MTVDAVARTVPPEYRQAYLEGVARGRPAIGDGPEAPDATAAGDRAAFEVATAAGDTAA